MASFAGVDTSGTNGSGAIVQNAEGSGNSGTALATLAAFGGAGNVTYGCIGKAGGANAVTPGANFVEIHDTASTTPAYRVFSEWFDGQDTTVDGTFTSTVWGCIAVEIKVAAAGTAVMDIIGSGIIAFAR